MTISADIQKLDPGAVIELFELDCTALGGQLLRFHAGVNALGADLTWVGNVYTRYPIDASGFEQNARGTLPRPKIRVANVTGLVSSLARELNDLVGAKLTRKRTFLRYLDAVNFAGGNPSADPAQAFADEVWFVDRKASENRVLVEFELAAAFDLTGVKLPRRQVVQNVCAWQYRSAECSYAGGAVADLNDAPTTILENDQCGKRLASCKLRFGLVAQLPFGGFPACGLLR